MVFEPALIRVAAGDTVKFIPTDPGHNAETVRGMAPEGSEPLTFDELVTHCTAAGLMRQKIPERLEVVDALPRNQTLNKILKYKLREQYG